MSTEISSTARPVLYAENHSTVPTYLLTEEKIRKSLGEFADRLEIVIRPGTDPDLEALARARYFFALRFDTQRLRDTARNLHVVHCLNAGVERYSPFDWLAPDTVFTNSSGIHEDMIGEYGLMALLMLNRRIPAYVALQRASTWKPTLASPIHGKTVLIIGTGGLGAAIAERAALVGMNVIGINRSGASVAGFPSVSPMAQLDQALSLADFVVLACPLTAATRGFFNRERIACMKPGAGLVNVARGPVLETAAMIDALKSGQLSGVVVDVVDVEPMPADNALWQVEGLIITPHVSCDTADGYVERGLAIFADNLQREARGEALRNVVDRSLGY
jgi:phosphoglycerate dehydrogenase-like enzyme